MLQLYKNIKTRRTELGLTQSELANKMGYADKSMIAKIEKGVIDLPQSKIFSFAEALETTPSYLMGWEQIDSRFSGKEAPEEMQRKLIENIERHHGKTKELLNIYEQLSPENKKRTLQYTKGLLSIQEMDSALQVNTAHARTDINIPESPQYLESIAAHNDYADDKEQQKLMKEDLDEL